MNDMSLTRRMCESVSFPESTCSSGRTCWLDLLWASVGIQSPSRCRHWRMVERDWGTGLCGRQDRQGCNLWRWNCWRCWHWLRWLPSDIDGYRRCGLLARGDGRRQSRQRKLSLELPSALTHCAPGYLIATLLSTHWFRPTPSRSKLYITIVPSISTRPGRSLYLRMSLPRMSGKDRENFRN